MDFVRSWNGAPFDLIFIDPPFLSGGVQEVLASLGSADILSDDGFVVARHHRREEVEVPGVFELVKQRKFGESVVIFLKKA